MLSEFRPATQTALGSYISPEMAMHPSQLTSPLLAHSWKIMRWLHLQSARQPLISYPLKGLSRLNRQPAVASGGIWRIPASAEYRQLGLIGDCSCSERFLLAISTVSIFATLGFHQPAAAAADPSHLSQEQSDFFSSNPLLRTPSISLSVS